MVDKVENLKLIDKPRITFNDFRIIELLSNIYIKLNFKIYNHLANSRYKYLFLINLKYAYFIISLYSENRYYFTFTISRINQI